MPSSARRDLLLGLGFAIAGSVLFSGKAIVVKLAYRYGVDASTLIAIRMAFAAPFFAATYAWVSRNASPLSASEHGRLIVIGLFGYYAASYLDFLGLKYVTAGLERLILFLNPTVVVLISVAFLGKRYGRREIMSLGLAYAGIALAVWHDVKGAGDNVPLGSALVFASAVCYAIYLVMAGEVVRQIGAIRLTSYAMLVSSLAVGIQFAVVNPWSALVQPAQVYWLSLVNATVCTVLPVFATMLAIERIGAGRTSLAAMVGPVSTIVLAYLVLGESVGAWQMVGTALVLAGVYVLSTAEPRSDATREKT